MKFIISIAAALGAALAAVGTTGCYMIFIDEPEMPKHLIER